MKKARTLLTLLCLIPLTACVTREQADEKLANGCAAGVELFLSEGFHIKSIKKKLFKNDPDLGAGFRDVTLYAVESDSWLDVDKEYKCIFAESFGFLSANYTASIYQIKVNEQTYGKEGNKILGTFEDHLKLTQTVDEALNK
ncbi:MAG: hypothetical protein KDI13_06760 [Alphaproteobacteria bacterium]|nr:hypothetical protein [Alphaproteobacteria bacterium]